MTNYFLRIRRRSELRGAVSEDVHIALAPVFQAGDEYEFVIGKRLALLDVALDRSVVKILGMIGYAGEGATIGEEYLAQLRQREFAVRVGAMHVHCALKHGAFLRKDV